MKVSLVIACYRDSKTLKRALDSVLQQTYNVDEILIINDASPETSEIERVIPANQKIKYLLNKQNIGLAASRNKGVAACSGDVVTFLDADDELHPEKIERQITLYNENVALSCDCVCVRNNEYPTEAIRPGSGKNFTLVRSSNRLAYRNTLTGASLLISRALFLKVGGYDPTLRSCEDFDLWLRLLDAGVPIINVRLPLYVYHQNPSGLSRNTLNISKWELVVIGNYMRRQRRLTRSRRFRAVLLASWLFRHLVRSKGSSNSELFSLTNRNLRLLKPWCFVKSLLSILIFFRVPTAVAWAMARSNE